MRPLLALEPRTFEQRFGQRCPFCNRSWGDPSPCGDSRADWTYAGSMRMFFAKPKDCATCGTAIPYANTYCSACMEQRQRFKNSVSRHRIVSDTCIQCGSEFTRRSDKKRQRYCSISCGNRARAVA